MVVMIIGDGGDIDIVIFCETIWMLSSWCNCLSLFVFNSRFHVLFTCETMWMMSPLTKPRPASLQGIYLSSWTKWTRFNFDKNLNINLNLCLKNNHGQNEFLSCEVSEKNGFVLQRDCSQREPSDEPDSLEEMVFLQIGWMFLDLRFVICNMQYAMCK